MKSKLTAILLGILLVLPAAPLALTAGGVPPSQSNPSVIKGSQALLNGPYLSSVTYPIFSNDHASVDSLLAGGAQIVDYPPDIADLRTALAANYVNVTTEYGSSFENLIFNLYCAPGTPALSCPGSNQLGMRQALADLFNATYAQQTVLNGIQGVVSQNTLYPPAFGPYSTNNIFHYSYSTAAATAALMTDPQIAFNAAAHPTNTGGEYACTSSQTGVWQYATSMGSGHPNGTDFNPKFYTRPDHATWFQETQQIWQSAASIGFCFDMKSVVHFSGIYPIVYKAYSNKWAVYFGGASYSSPLNPVSTLYFAYGTAGFVTPFDNTSHYTANATVQAWLQEMYTTGNASLAQADARKVVQDVSHNIPTFNTWWDAWSIPSLNNFGGVYWSGYVDTPGFGSWTFSVGYYTLLNLHRVNPSTGAPITGGNAIVNLHEAPDDYNIWFATSVYDFDVINSIFFDTPMAAPPGSPYAQAMVPWMLTHPATITEPVNATTPHGHKIVNGQVIHLDFMKNITWQDNVPFTASDYNFSMWYANANGAYGPYVANTGNYVGVLATLADSQVTSKYGMDIYVNSTSFADYVIAVVGIPVMAQHLWSHITSAQFNADIDPTNPANDVNGQLLQTGTGAFYWHSFASGAYVNLQRFAGYFRTNIHAWQLPQVQAGNAEPLSFAITQMGTPIPSSASAKAWASLNGGTPVSTSLTLGSSGNWTGSFNTQGWASGFYEVTVNATYTDANGFHTALQFYGLNVAPAPPPLLSNLQVTVTNSQGQPITGATVTVGSQSLTTASNGQALFQGLTPGTVTVSVTATGFVAGSTSVTLVAGQTSNAAVTLATPSTTHTSVSVSISTSTTTSTASAPDYTLYYIAAAVIIVLAIIGAALYSRRGK